MTALRWLILIILLVAVAWFAGFLHFVHGLRNPDGRPDSPADGIVVLTGGPNRIATGLRLLEAGRGRRLLISGVNPDTTRADLIRALGHKDQFACCVEIGYAASDTQGNASEAAGWAARRGYHSLIIVTAAAHMPRALAEMQGAMPDLELIPHPAIPGDRMAAAWWRDGRTAGLLAREYSKYLVSLARLHLGFGVPN